MSEVYHDGVPVEGGRLQYEEVGDYLIGVDLKPIITAEAKKAACTFLEPFRNTYSPVVNRLSHILDKLDDSEDQRH